jgi:hypothetical protein
MKGVSHDNRLKSCSQSGGGGERSPVLRPGAANHRAVIRLNPIEPRNATIRVAKPSRMVKPASLPSSTTHRQWTLRGRQEQRDGTDLLGTWEIPHGARHQLVTGAWQLHTGINNCARSRAGKSVRPIVAMKPSNVGGAKGPWPITCRLRQYLDLIGDIH